MWSGLMSPGQAQETNLWFWTETGCSGLNLHRIEARLRLLTNGLFVIVVVSRDAKKATLFAAVYATTVEAAWLPGEGF